MIGGQQENNFSWASDEITGLLFYGTEQANQIDKHDAVCKFQLVVETINFAPIFGNGGKGNNIVQVEVEGGVDVINQGINMYSSRVSSALLMMAMHRTVMSRSTVEMWP